ncbi:queuine tRNA-ribosyltransferase tRNA-guanine transglycosylase [Halobaculum sp. MBLA0147]|uniref:queuine tRNA-ribosyltransferase tRNA-guanine transglycosylase n=1 Tax=Halobaculum sp. MBLA0147 TaxID=3079934 RepID=UPI003523E4A9
MRFYVPEWDDAVDAAYDFHNDDLSTLDKSERERAFIWDVFDRETTPIDGVLISREQVESSSTKFERLTTNGVYDDPELAIPDWLPTISDCGAWGYKSLPFPPYGNEGMLTFYDELDVSTGVTIDHLVLGSGKEEGRLYVDERAFGEHLTVDDIPDEFTASVDVMADTWPTEWPSYVDEYEPSITGVDNPEQFRANAFEGSVDSVLTRLADDPRAVYRTDDEQFRYDLTLRNAREMADHYDSDSHDFRLMAAFQGWDPESYAQAAETVLELGYDYVGMGGLAGSPASVVRDVVAEVGTVIDDFERREGTRIDNHLFGFAKTDAFDTIGRGGVTSFDSASMLRAAWTGGKNYHLDADEKFDAIRVRYGAPGESLSTTVEKSLQGYELMQALRAYDAETAINEAVSEWVPEARETLTALTTYLDDHRHDDRYDQTRIRDTTEVFREDFAYGAEVQGFFGEQFRKRVVKLLRADDPDDSLAWHDYLEVIETASTELETAPWTADAVAEVSSDGSSPASFDHLWPVVESYAELDSVDDTDKLDGYRRTLRRRPWDECDCPLCTEHGVEIAVFRGNDRNRRRGFHNTYRFYRQLERDLPAILVATTRPAPVEADTTEAELQSERPTFWEAVHDLPVAEVAVLDDGVHEWWADPDGEGLTGPTPLDRYTTVFLYDPDDTATVGSSTRNPSVERFGDPSALRSAVLDHLGYDDDYLPRRTVQQGLGDY